MSNLRRVLSSTLSLAALVSSAGAQTPLVETGDPVDGLGDVALIHHVVVNDAGDWLAWVDIGLPTGGTAQAVVDASGVVFHAGQPLPPSNAAVDGLRSAPVWRKDACRSPDDNAGARLHVANLVHPLGTVGDHATIISISAVS